MDSKRIKEQNENAIHERVIKTTKKQMLSSKEKDVWTCECGKTNNEIEGYCGSCNKDIYGFKTNEKTPSNVASYIQQKIELNSLLKDIDLNELKMLTQNNAMVNSSLNTLMSRWDKVQSKMDEIQSHK